MDTIENSHGSAPDGRIYADPRTRAAWNWETWRDAMLAAAPEAPAQAVVQLSQCVGCQQVDYCKAKGCINAAMTAAPEEQTRDIEAIIATLEVDASLDRSAPESDYYIIENAMQRGFEMLNDEGNVYAVGERKLVEFVKLYLTEQTPELWCVTCDGAVTRNVYPDRSDAEEMKAHLDKTHPGHKREVVPFVRSSA